MTLTLLNYQAELLIPLFGIVFTFAIPIIAIYLYYRQKSRIMDERKLMIERGMVPPEIIESSKKEPPLSRGINFLAIALGILTGYAVSQQWHTNDGISILCAILFWLGIANVLKSFLFSNDKLQNHE